MLVEEEKGPVDENEAGRCRRWSSLLRVRVQLLTGRLVAGCGVWSRAMLR